MLIITSISPEDLVYAINREGSPINLRYAGNVYITATPALQRRDGRYQYRFTLETADAWAKGSRTACSGRHMRKASWEAHRDVLDVIFAMDGCARIKSALATYDGRADFNSKFRATADKNVGSQAAPVRFVDTSI